MADGFTFREYGHIFVSIAAAAMAANPVQANDALNAIRLKSISTNKPFRNVDASQRQNEFSAWERHPLLRLPKN